MPYRDDHPDHWREDRGRRGADDRFGRTRGDGEEARSFGEQGRFNSDQARYYGADERNYAGRGRNADGPGYRDYGAGYGGQEYGLGAGERSYGRPRQDDGERSGPRRGGGYGQGPYGDQSLPHGAGVADFGAPADYAYHPDRQELDSDYVTWRDQQMREHDRDYAGWRAEQHRKYDEDYRTFRGERRNHFHQTFEQWRQSQQQAGGRGSEFAKPSPEVQQLTDGEAPSPLRKAGDGKTDGK